MLQIPSHAAVTDWRRRDTELDEVAERVWSRPSGLPSIPSGQRLFPEPISSSPRELLRCDSNCWILHRPDGVVLTSRAGYHILEQLMVSAMLAITSSIQAFCNTSIPRIQLPTSDQ